ncbi:TPA: hypothetical protein ACX3MK_005052 [Raoultella ornithinolytica]
MTDAELAHTKELAFWMVERVFMNPISAKLLNEDWRKAFPDEVAVAERMKALVEALEKAQSERDELRLGFIANQEEAHEAIKYATELKEQLSRACAGREEAFREVDEMQKSLDHTHRRRAIWREKAVTAETEIAALRQRIAELESCTVTAENLQESAYRAGLTAGWNFGLENNNDGFNKCLAAHVYGIKWEAE